MEGATDPAQTQSLTHPAPAVSVRTTDTTAVLVLAPSPELAPAWPITKSGGLITPPSGCRTTHQCFLKSLLNPRLSSVWSVSRPRRFHILYVANCEVHLPETGDPEGYQCLGKSLKNRNRYPPRAEVECVGQCCYMGLTFRDRTVLQHPHAGWGHKHL